MKKLLLPCFLIITCYSFGQTKLTIQSSNEKCATVISNNRDLAWGDQGFWANRAGHRFDYFTLIRSFLQFDLSSIPAGSKLNWARLTLYPLSAFIGGANTCLLRRITSPWDPNTVTWNTQPATSLRGTVKLPANKGADPDIYKNIDVWKLVQVMIDSPSTSFGFALRLDTEENTTESGSVLFYTPAFGKPHYNPKLVLEYTPPGMNPAVTSMSVDASGSTTVLKIYPNPCHDYFNCSVKSADAGNESLRVVDMLGRTVNNQPVTSSNQLVKVNLPIGSAGTYFVILQNNSGPIVFQELQVD